MILLLTSLYTALVKYITAYYTCLSLHNNKKPSTPFVHCFVLYCSGGLCDSIYVHYLHYTIAQTDTLQGIVNHLSDQLQSQVKANTGINLCT